MSQEKTAEIIDLNASRALVAGGESAGEFLANARQAAGFSLAEICEATKIKRAHLEAIEASNAGALPPLPYVVGFVKVYAAHLGLDAEEVAKKYRDEMQAAAPEAERLKATTAVVHSEPISHGARFISLLGIVAILVFAVWITMQIVGNSQHEADAAKAAGEAAPRVRIGGQAAPTPHPRVIAPATEETAGEDTSATNETPADVTPDDKIEAPAAGAASDAAAPLSPTPAAKAPGAPASTPAEETQNIAPAAPLVVKARLTRSVSPRYPAECTAAAAEMESVTVLFDVTTGGHTANAAVLTSSNDCFNEAALDSVARWRFSPRSVDGAAEAALGKRATLNFQR